MRIAALYDIHGNVPALEAVIDEIRDVECIVVGGDVVWGPWPHQTLEILRSRPRIRFLMGNADRAVVDGLSEAGAWCADHLTQTDLEFIDSWPSTISLEGILFCHGSPRSDTEPITKDTKDELILEMFQGVEESTVVFGHTHSQFMRTVGRHVAVNPGSVGLPIGEVGAFWALFDDGGVHLRRTDYDVERAAKAVRATEFPRREAHAKELVSPYPTFS